MAETIFLNWRDELERTRFPFTGTSTFTNSSGDVLPAKMFHDAVFYPVGSTAAFYLSAVVLNELGVTIWFSNDTERVCKISFGAAFTLPDTLAVYDTYGRVVGTVVPNKSELQGISAWSPGEHLFDRTAAAVVPDAVIPTPERGLRGFLVNGELFSGNVILVAVNGVKFRTNSLNAPDRIFHLDAVGDPLFVRMQCETGDEGEPSTFIAGPYLKTINSITPTPQGRFVITPGIELVPDTVVRITPESRGIQIKLIATNPQGALNRG